ncbi:hypothetical protein P170DRAFT_456902 [Aspergillus steynii IBT 23096]|uniref:Uncharacterized protein n=1 Tax=Aspergillus steynii IBT 23096 TaxID=1392250 RepID=A0A2I2G646_9EURO|nr:uncharacterized protein P170DRAFT_456902 [Aspergillus steynii IBT 23096]PLB48351.1 hypothetical protein P170DRAFT_456902 [Aspergillus steynii IBT 23096]
MRPTLLFVTCLAVTSIAAPTLFDHAYDYSDDMAGFLGKVSKHIDKLKDLMDTSTTCDASKIALPSFASELPSPSGQKPLYVAVGRGTQNYTCATSSSDSKPEAVGAVARLYNATCIAASYPDMIEMLPSIVYKMQLPDSDDDPLPPANIDLLGHHYFAGSTPVFNFDLASTRHGIAFTKKGAEIDAPSSAVKGGNGAVAWLYLSTVNGTVGRYKSVYRVDTAAGQAPKTCKNMPSQFTVQYAANYYFYER